jgi:5'-3' exonuclease
MNHAGLVDAVITDDSDAFLFGATHVYRNVFESKKYVEVYAASRITAELGLGLTLVHSSAQREHFLSHVVGCFAGISDKTAQVEQRCGRV